MAAINGSGFNAMSGVEVQYIDGVKHLYNPRGEIYGYARVSTAQQKTDRQIDALLEYGVEPDHIFQEKVSGKNFNREKYKKMIRVIRKGDIIVIKSVDRIGRNYQDIIDQWRMITQDIGCGIHVIDMPMLNVSGDPADLISKFVTDMMLQVLSFVAENERANTIQRQQEGLKAAKKRNTYKMGRPRAKIPFEFWAIFLSWKTGEYTTAQLSEHCYEAWGMSNRTFYRRIRELDERYGDLPPETLKRLIVEDDFKDGIEFSMERVEAALGYASPYTGDKEYTLKMRHRKAERAVLEAEEAAAEQEASEEEELKRIVLLKRQEALREQFGLPSETAAHPYRGRLPSAGRPMTAHKRAIEDAKSASVTAVKTVVVD